MKSSVLKEAIPLFDVVASSPETVTSPVAPETSIPSPATILVTAEVFGDADSNTKTWILKRNQVADATEGNAETMATANINTADSSISNATIDNSTYMYWIQGSDADTNQIIYGAKITYTTDYI